MSSPPQTYQFNHGNTKLIPSTNQHPHPHPNNTQHKHQHQKNHQISIHAHSHKNPRQILSEDEYTNTLQSIITRDYFPAIPSLRRDTAILHARAIGNTPQAVAIRRAARQLELADQLETEEAEQGVNNTKKIVLKQLSIDAFHRVATSEDNDEFELVQQEEIRNHRAFVQHVYESALSTKHLRTNCITEEYRPVEGMGDDALSLLASDQFNPTPQRFPSSSLESSKDGGNFSKNTLFFTPLSSTKRVGSALNVPGITDRSTHVLEGKASLKLVKNNRDHQLMPPPSSVSASSKSNPISSSISSKPCYNHNHNHNHNIDDEDGNNNDREKRIQPSQTRFPHQSTSSLHPSTTNITLTHQSSYTSKQNTTASHEPSVDDYYSSTTATDLDASPQSISQERFARQSYLANDRQTFVNLTPVILPGVRIPGTTKEHEDLEEPIMTWGDVASTPLAIHTKRSTISTPPPPPPPTPSLDIREQIAQRLVTRTKEKRLQEIHRIQPPSNSNSNSNFNSHRLSVSASLQDRTVNLTPAAKSLLRATIGSSVRSTTTTSMVSRLGLPKRPKRSMTPNNNGGVNARSRSAFGSALRDSYSNARSSVRSHGTTSNVRNSTSHLRNDAVVGATPRVGGRRSSSRGVKSGKRKNDALRTDNLLEF